MIREYLHYLNAFIVTEQLNYSAHDENGSFIDVTLGKTIR
jgi:hypothetical protein